VVRWGLAKEIGANRISGEVDGLRIELRLQEGEGGRCWRVMLIGRPCP
jgi:hypothetical protein